MNNTLKRRPSCPLGAYIPSPLLCWSLKSRGPCLFLLQLPDQFLGPFLIKKKYNPKALGFQIALDKLELNKYFIVKPKIATWLLPSIRQIENVSTVGSGGKSRRQQLKTDVAQAGSPSWRDQRQAAKVNSGMRCQYHLVQLNGEARSQGHVYVMATSE